MENRLRRLLWSIPVLQRLTRQEAICIMMELGE